MEVIVAGKGDAIEMVLHPFLLYGIGAVNGLVAHHHLVPSVFGELTVFLVVLVEALSVGVVEGGADVEVVVEDVAIGQLVVILGVVVGLVVVEANSAVFIRVATCRIITVVGIHLFAGCTIPADAGLLLAMNDGGLEEIVIAHHDAAQEEGVVIGEGSSDVTIRL